MDLLLPKEADQQDKPGSLWIHKLWPLNDLAMNSECHTVSPHEWTSCMFVSAEWNSKSMDVVFI